MEFAQACVIDHNEHKLDCIAVVMDFWFYTMLWKYSSENNLPLYDTEFASSDITMLNCWSVHKRHDI